MRLLNLLQGAAPADQCGYDDGFKRLVADGMLEHYEVLCYRSPEAAADIEAFYRHAADIFENTNCDTLLLQFFHGPPPPTSLISEVRRRNRNALVITTCGDPFGRFFVRPPQGLIEATALSDLSFYTGLGHIVAPALEAGAKNILFMPHGSCQVRFAPSNTARPQNVDDDIVFIGSRLHRRNPLSYQARAVRQRHQMATALQKRFGKRFALYGHGWDGFPSWRGPLPFLKQHEAMRAARLVVGGFPMSDAPYYMSDRPFIAMASGVPLLDVLGPSCDRVLAPGEHVHSYTDVNGLLAQIERLLPDDSSQVRAELTAKWIASKHMHSHRSRVMIDIAKQLRACRASGDRMPEPDLPYVTLPVVKASTGSPAVLAWSS